MHGLCSDLNRHILHPYHYPSIHISPFLVQSYFPQCSVGSMLLPYSVPSPNMIVRLERQVVISHLDHHSPSIFLGVLTQEFRETVPSFLMLFHD